VDPTAYNRRFRKAIHVLAGFPAFILKFLTPSQVFAFVLAMAVVSFLLRPNWPFLRNLAKPEDMAARGIRGVRNYFVTVLLLAALFGARYPELVTAGWLALAWGDGAAGLVGSKQNAKLPWSRTKTVVGFVACACFVYLAMISALIWHRSATGFLAAWPAQAALLAIALVIAAAESAEQRLDDNYIVGLGTAGLMWVASIMGVW
jgi:phytol kinase